MTFAKHDATHRDQRTGRHSELFGPEKAGDRNVASGLHATVGLDHDAPTKVVLHENLLGLGDSKLPGQSGVLDRRLRGGARAAAVSADQNDVAMPFRYASRDGAHAGFGHEFDVDASAGIGVLEVVDELRQILDRVDVVVRRRRDELDARGRIPDPADVLVDFVPR